MLQRRAEMRRTRRYLRHEQDLLLSGVAELFLPFGSKVRGKILQVSMRVPHLLDTYSRLTPAQRYLVIQLIKGRPPMVACAQLVARQRTSSTMALKSKILPEMGFAIGARHHFRRIRDTQLLPFCDIPQSSKSDDLPPLVPIVTNIWYARRIKSTALQEEANFGSYCTPAIVAAGKGISLEDAHEMREFPLVTVCQSKELAFFVGCFGGQTLCDCQHVSSKRLGEERCFR